MMSFLSSSVTSELRGAYLDRLGLEAEPPSAEGLRRLHRRHGEVPYETLWNDAGETWGINPTDGVARLEIHRDGDVGPEPTKSTVAVVVRGLAPKPRSPSGRTRRATVLA